LHVLAAPREFVHGVPFFEVSGVPVSVQAGVGEHETVPRSQTFAGVQAALASQVQVPVASQTS
jgi:hypothetical protein